MTGHGTPNVSKLEVEIPSDLYDLCQHLGKHAREEPLLIMEVAAVMGLAEIFNSVQRMCLTAQLAMYLETHSERLGVRSLMAVLTDDRKN